MVPTLFSTDDETWPLMAVLTWIATRSLKFVESYVGRDVFDADALLALAREGFGTPPNIGYPEAFQALCEKVDAKQIRGHGTKLKWIVAPEHELLSPERCFTLAQSVEEFESSDFQPQDLRNANVACSPALQLKDFVFSRRRLSDTEGQRIRLAKPRRIAHALDVEGRNIRAGRCSSALAGLGLLRGLEASEGENLEAVA